MEGAKSEPDLGIANTESLNGDEEYLEENKENFAPDDQFDDKNIK